MPLIDVSKIKGVSLDSRGVKRGYLFAALPGRKQDGSKFIADAIMNGATHILAAPGTMLPEGVSKGVSLVTDENPRRAFSQITAAYYKKQPRMIVAVTGTNGKTSSVHFINQLWKAIGVKAASLGTLGLSVQGGAHKGGAMTTPDPVSLHAELADLAAVGVDHLAMEASSHGLDQYRLDGVQVKVAAFTNLSHDHLDYHQDMKAYLAAKARLFSDVLVKGGTAVLNADVPEYKSLRKACEKAGHKIFSYGEKGEEFRIRQMISLPSGLGLDFEALGRTYHIILPLIGAFQCMNALCALACVAAEEPDNRARVDELVKAMERLKGVPGRLEIVPGRSDFAVYVDYAHTPDALASVLRALSEHKKGKLFCLFGCGGNRDHAKRPAMGKIASEIADVTVITDDNPRHEKPEDIRAQIMTGIKRGSEVHEVPDRRRAILFAIERMQAGDILVVAGKGHEKGQVFNGHTEPFDDVEEVRKAMGG